jgi:hypothetical protein
MLCPKTWVLKWTKSSWIKSKPSSTKNLGSNRNPSIGGWIRSLGVKIKHKDAQGNYPWSPPTNSNPNTSEPKEPTKIARKRHENPTSYKRGIDPTIKVPFTRRSDSLQTEEKSNPMEQGNEKQSGWVVCLKTLELIYMSPFRAGQKTTLPLVLKLWYNPLEVNRSRSTPFHRTTTPSPQTASFRRKPHDPATRPLASKLLGAPGSVSPHRASGLGFVAQPSNSTVLC